MKLFNTLLCFLLVSSTTSFAAELIKDPNELYCSGSNGLFTDQRGTGAAINLRDGDLRVNLASSEGQLIAYESGRPITNIASATFSIPFRQCQADLTKNLRSPRLSAMWCFEYEKGQSRLPDDSPSPMKVVIKKKDGTTVSFENLNYKFTLTHASINDTATYSTQNSIELNVSDKRTHDEKVARQESFVIFKGNNLRCD